jgi:hypothetical protein
MTDTTELVVPRSIPMIFAIELLLIAVMRKSNPLHKAVASQ